MFEDATFITGQSQRDYQVLVISLLVTGLTLYFSEIDFRLALEITGNPRISAMVISMTRGYTHEND